MGQGFSRHQYQRHAPLVTKEDEESGTSTDETGQMELQEVQILKEKKVESDTEQLRRAAAEHNLERMKICNLSGADPGECDENGMTALHHACQFQKTGDDVRTKEVIMFLLEKGCDRKIDATDNAGHTALVYAIKNRNSCAALTLINKRADFRSRINDTGNTALHEACLAGLFDVVERMFQCASGNPVDWEGHQNARPLHAACECSHLKIVETLIEKGASTTVEDEEGNTPLHVASSEKSSGSAEVINILLKHGALKNLEAKNKKTETPLRIACYYGHHEIVKVLFDKGATVDKICMKYAVEKGYSYTARILLRSPEWRECLRQTLQNGEPIMNDIIRKMPEVAADVFDKCTVQCEKKSDKEGCVAFDFEFLECFNEAGLGHDNITVKEEFEDVIKQHKWSFNPRWGPQRFKKSHHPLAVIVKSGNCHLLTHPVLRALLYHKWIIYGLLYTCINVVLFLLFLAFATSFSLYVAIPLSQECPAQGNETCTIPELKQNRIQIIAIMTIIFAVLCLLLTLGKELILMYKLGLKDFISTCILYDWMDIPSYMLVIIFVVIFPYDCPCPSVWQWQIGIIGLLLSWITLPLKFSNKFPVIGKYVVMFERIIKTFLKVALIIGIPLILAFTWPFYMALNDPNVSRSPFQNAGLAIAKVLSMTAGNFEYYDIFRRDASGERDNEKELTYLPVVYILWIVFIILMPILLNNLLVGLAVGDIRSVEQQAQLRKRILKVQLVLQLEQLLPARLRAKLRTGYRVVKPKLRIKWYEPRHRSVEILQEVFDRKQHQAGKYSGKYLVTEHRTAKSLFKHAFIRKSKCKAFGSDLSQSSDLQARLERVENLLERMAEKMHVPI